MSDGKSGQHASGGSPGALTLGALGVVYGDIGTSPLYALRECFARKGAPEPTPENIIGVVSLVLWALLLIVAVKYLLVVMRASNRGEGGILALLALAFPRTQAGRGPRAGVIFGIGVFGAALLYGDGMITPAISVLSAVEGTSVATPAFNAWILPVTIATLVALFAAQRQGTGQVGAVFGPVMALWFLVVAFLGFRGILSDPVILQALSPGPGAAFLGRCGWGGFVVLGSVFLAVTGAEALYADMGHFGIAPIRRAWFLLVMPALFLSYLGQGALMIRSPEAVQNPFFLLAPRWSLFPLTGLATAATVIASQALISGAFSLSLQAIQLGYLPRLQVRHTSSTERGQIYMPQVNWILMVASIGLVLGFRESTRLAAAYGIAVTLAMLTTTVLFFFASRRLWGWSPWLCGAVCLGLGSVEGVFFAANSLKILSGGWFPLAAASCLFLIMTTWKRGRELLWARLQPRVVPLELFLDDPELARLPRVAGTAVFMSGNPEGTPLALLHNLKHNRILHSQNILLTLTVEDLPAVEPGRRFFSEPLAPGFTRVIARHGYMEEPNVPGLLEALRTEGVPFDLQSTSFFLGRESISPMRSREISPWRHRLFSLLVRNAESAYAYYRIPPDRVVELGIQVEI